MHKNISNGIVAFMNYRSSCFQKIFLKQHIQMDKTFVIGPEGETMIKILEVKSWILVCM